MARRPAARVASGGTSLLVAERRRTGQIALLHFYWRRALRLLPALGTATVLAVLLAVIARPDLGTATDREAVAAALYVANWAAVLPGAGSDLLHHAWSLSIEEQFYLAWPLVLWGLVALGGHRTALWASLAGILVVAVHRLDVSAQAAYYRTDTRADCLLVGCAIALAAADGALGGVPTWLVRAGAAGGAAVLVTIAATNAPGLGVAAGYTLVALAAGSVIISLGLHQLPMSTRLLSWRPVVAVGRRSYGVYLYHYPLYHAVVETRLGQGPGALALTASLTLLVATASYRHVEAPLRRRRINPVAHREVLAAPSTWPRVASADHVPSTRLAGTPRR